MGPEAFAFGLLLISAILECDAAARIKQPFAGIYVQKKGKWGMLVVRGVGAPLDDHLVTNGLHYGPSERSNHGSNVR